MALSEIKSIPVNLPAEVQNRIIEDRSEYWLKMADKAVQRYVGEKRMAGITESDRKARRAKYTELIDIDDVPIMTNENWLEEFARGLHPMPKSPYLQQLAQNSSQFLNVQRDFRNLFNSTAAFM